MHKLIPTLLLLLALALPCSAFAATVSGTLTQISAHSTRLLEKITVILESAEGKSTKTTTDKDGNYRFTGVGEGRYRIKVQLPSDHVPALMNEHNRLLPAQTSNGETDWFDVNGNKTVDLASTRATVFIKFIGFVDENANGGRMNSEPALRDAQVSVHPAGRPDVLVASGTTDKKGELTLDSLSPGEYQVRVIYPENYSAGPLGSKLSFYYNCIKASDTQEAWSEPFSLTTGSQGIGIGAVATGSAQGHIWYDANGDGKKNPEEKGFSGVQVDLIYDADGLSRTTRTDSDGNYSFTRLQPGSYSVQVTAPDGYMFAQENGDSWLTEGYSNVDKGTVTVTAEKTQRIPQVGLMNATSLQIAFYHDDNANGMKDENESGYSGADVTIVRDGCTLKRADTDENGNVFMPIIRAGTIQVGASLKETDIFSSTGIDNDFALTLPGSYSIVESQLAPGELTTLYAAVTVPAQVGGMLFMDGNNDGVKAQQEQPVPGFTVQAVDWTGQIVDTTVTDTDGTYHFDRLLPIPHTIRFLLNDPYISSPYADNGNSIVTQNSDYGETALLQLTPGSYTGNVNGGLFKAGTISGRILLTDDRPAGMGPGLEGLTVTLIDLEGNLVSDYTTVHSEADGTYYLKGILPGEYRLRYTLPEDSLFAETDELTVNSVPFVSGLGTDTKMADLFAIRTATIEGQVICESEPADAVITALNTENGYSVSFSAESASGGHFAIHLLRPGTWQVTVELNEGFSFAEDTDLVPAIAHHTSEKQYTFVMGDALMNQRIMVTRPATLTGQLFQDENLDNVYAEGEVALNNREIILVNRNGETVAEMKTDESGRFESPKLIPGKYQVTVPLDEDCILLQGYQVSEENWVQEAEAVSGRNTDVAVPVLRFASIGGKLWSLDEKLDFVAGLTVELYDEQSMSAPISVTKTNKQGNYLFPRLYPGRYRLTVKLPEGHGFARRADTDETHISLILSNDNKDMSDPLVLHMGINISNADFGFGAKGSIGDLAWLDTNENGMQDIGEPGIPRIRIQLYQGDELLAETETDLYGHYMFEGIYPGRYTLRVTPYPELKSTVHQTDFPLIGSVLPETEDTTINANEVIVPSGTRNLAVDVGFRPRQEGILPDVMNTIPTTDWSFGGKKR